MTLLDLLTKAAGMPADMIRSILAAAAKAAPDLAPAIQVFVEKLEAGLTAENLSIVGSTILKEAADIAQGKINPADHPSDAG